jgi:hypothetical protein
MDLREMGCEDGRWIELAQDRVQWQALILAVLNLCVMLFSSVSQWVSMEWVQQFTGFY